jgi:hypothetical protein
MKTLLAIFVSAILISSAPEENTPARDVTLTLAWASAVAGLLHYAHEDDSESD